MPKFIKIEAMSIFGTTLCLKVPEAKIIKFNLCYKKEYYLFIFHMFTKIEKQTIFWNQTGSVEKSQNFQIPTAPLETIAALVFI